MVFKQYWRKLFKYILQSQDFTHKIKTVNMLYLYVSHYFLTVHHLDVVNQALISFISNASQLWIS